MARSTARRPAGSTVPKSTAAVDPGGSPKGSIGPVIRIRMYRVGFGDCFLLSLPAAGGDRHVLIDCGVHSRGDLRKIADAVQDVAALTNGRLDIVIATHAHQDHISGFATCAAAFEKMSVGEVWLPWTEDPKDADAIRFRTKQAALAAFVGQHLAADGIEGHALHCIQNLVGNESALKLLKSGINGGNVRYFSSGQTLDAPAGIEGLAVRVLGPPRDPKFLARMDPPAGDRFFRLGVNGKESVNAIVPFEPKWKVVAADWAEGLLSDEDARALGEMAEDPEGLAFMLDQAMNNTSLVTLFSYKGQHLLFPGDAQYGNWQNWVDGPEAQEILESVDFYKVAHHGSLNATPKSALDKMTKGRFAAMVSTQSVPWPSIPFGKLMAALTEKASGVVRSDSIPIPDAPSGPPSPVPSNFTRGAFWYDYAIPV
jgi:hypothetical protein